MWSSNHDMNDIGASTRYPKMVKLRLLYDLWNCCEWNLIPIGMIITRMPFKSFYGLLLGFKLYILLISIQGQKRSLFLIWSHPLVTRWMWERLISVAKVVLCSWDSKPLKHEFGGECQLCGKSILWTLWQDIYDMQ